MKKWNEANSRENSIKGQNLRENECLSDYDPDYYGKEDFYSNKSNSLEIELEKIIPDNKNSSSISKKSIFLRPIYNSCSKCKNHYKIKIIDSKHVILECGCECIEKCKLDKFIKNYCSNKSSYICCKKHGKKYINYCKECKMDICEECKQEKAIFINDNGKRNKHETHPLINLLDIKQDLKEIENLFDTYTDIDEGIKNLTVILLEHYEENPSYNAYKSIKKIKEFLEQIYKKNEENENDEENEESEENEENEEKIKINSIEGLNENIKSSEKIYKIEIDGEETEDIMEDLNILKNKKFDELKILQMSNIKKLKDIQALCNCSLKKLKRLVLESEELTDNCIGIIKNLELPSIKYFSLYNNKITSPEIFVAIKKFETLEKFFIGENPFDKNKIKNNNIKYVFPPKLKELGLNNLFSNDTNYFITNNLIIKQLKILYISADGFNSLENFKTMELHLEQFWLMGKKEKGYLERIEDIKYLTSKESIKKIVLKQNKIKDIEKLVDIIVLFPNIQLINIEDNDIEKERVKKVIEKIEEKGFDKLKIKYN
jgi:hypothetical protein